MANPASVPTPKSTIAFWLRWARLELGSKNSKFLPRPFLCTVTSGQLLPLPESQFLHLFGEGAGTSLGPCHLQFRTSRTSLITDRVLLSG